MAWTGTEKRRMRRSEVGAARPVPGRRSAAEVLRSRVAVHRARAAAARLTTKKGL